MGFLFGCLVGLGWGFLFVGGWGGGAQGGVVWFCLCFVGFVCLFLFGGC